MNCRSPSKTPGAQGTFGPSSSSFRLPYTLRNPSTGSVKSLLAIVLSSVSRILAPSHVHGHPAEHGNRPALSAVPSAYDDEARPWLADSNRSDRRRASRFRLQRSESASTMGGFGSLASAFVQLRMLARESSALSSP